MKKRRTLIISLLLVAAIALGVGYAEITDILTINGNANVKPHTTNFVVEFAGEPTNLIKCTSHLQTDKTVASFNTTQLVEAGDQAKATYTIVNKSTQYNATVNAPTFSVSENEYFKVTTDWGTDSRTLAAKDGETEATTTFTVTVTLKKAVIEEQTFEFTITNNVEAVEVASN
jgi:hypothetical protein